MPLSYRVVFFQLAVGMVGAGGLSIWSSQEAFGALVATVACVLPNGLFAWRVHGERSPSRVLGAGVLKFIGTAGLMILALWWWQPAPLGFLGSLVTMQVAHAVGSAWLGSQGR